jgi:hypothetical protein
MGDKFQEPEETTEVTKARHSKMNKVLATLLGLFGVVGPVASAYIGYRQSKIEAAAEIATAHKESEAGYQAVSSPLGQILPVIVQMAGELAQVKAEVAMIRGNQTFNIPMTPASPLTPPLAPPLRLHPISNTIHVNNGLSGLGALGAIGSSGAGAGSSSSARLYDSSSPPVLPMTPTTPKADESPAALRPLLRPLPKSLHDAAEQIKLDDSW